MEEKKALIAMSGGVDSSVTALLMQIKGYRCIGMTMKLHNNEFVNADGAYSCGAPSDIEDAKKVAELLGMPHQVMNFMDGFKEKVVLPFVETYLDGATPNPCIDCNRTMKFGKLLQKALENECDVVATGHYVRKDQNPVSGLYRLKKALDETKDQTYVLYFLSQEQLQRLEFPMGDMIKTEARDLAEENGLINARKQDSQDICFVPDGNYKRIVEELSEEIRPGYHLPGEGNFVDRDGNILGKHKGYYYYTVGQRKGLGISAKEPLYVLSLDAEKNEVVLGSNEDLFKKEVQAARFHFIDPTLKGEITMRVSAKIRYRHKEQPGLLTVYADGTAKMVFDEPQRAATRGQSLVIYDGEYCLGGGIITG